MMQVPRIELADKNVLLSTVGLSWSLSLPAPHLQKKIKVTQIIHNLLLWLQIDSSKIPFHNNKKKQTEPTKTVNWQF